MDRYGRWLCGLCRHYLKNGAIHARKLLCKLKPFPDLPGIPLSEKDFWPPYSTIRADDYSRFLALARKGKTLSPFLLPRGGQEKSPAGLPTGRTGKKLRLLQEKFGDGKKGAKRRPGNQARPDGQHHPNSTRFHPFSVFSSRLTEQLSRQFLSASSGIFKTYRKMAPRNPPWVTTPIFLPGFRFATSSSAPEHRS